MRKAHTHTHTHSLAYLAPLLPLLCTLFQCFLDAFSSVFFLFEADNVSVTVTRAKNYAIAFVYLWRFLGYRHPPFHPLHYCATCRQSLPASAGYI